METRVIGSYQNEQQAIGAVAGLREQGLEANDISIVLNNKDSAAYLSKETGTHIHLEHTNESSSGGLVENVKEALSPDKKREQSDVTLIRLGLTEEEADKYDADIREGNIIVVAHEGTAVTSRSYMEHTATASSSEEKEMHASEKRAPSLRAVSSESKASADNQPLEKESTSTKREADAETEEQQALRLHEEKLDVSKKKVEKGEVEVRKEVVEVEKTIKVPVQREEVYIERRAVSEEDQDVTGTKIGEFSEGSEEIRVPVVEEQIEIKKTPVVTDEVVVGKRKYQETEETTEKVKREEARIEGEENIKPENRDK